MVPTQKKAAWLPNAALAQKGPHKTRKTVIKVQNFGKGGRVLFPLSQLFCLVVGEATSLWCMAITDAASSKGDLDTVKLISADGHVFVIDRRAAMVSGTIKSMLTGPGTPLLRPSFSPSYIVG